MGIPHMYILTQLRPDLLSFVSSCLESRLHHSRWLYQNSQVKCFSDKSVELIDEKYCFRKR